MKKIEDNNTLVFIVDMKANKRQIKDAVKKLYDVKAEKINTLIRPDGRKKAFVRLEKDVDALDVANKVRLACPARRASARRRELSARVAADSSPPTDWLHLNASTFIWCPSPFAFRSPLTHFLSAFPPPFDFIFRPSPSSDLPPSSRIPSRLHSRLLYPNSTPTPTA